MFKSSHKLPITTTVCNRTICFKLSCDNEILKNTFRERKTVNIQVCKLVGFSADPSSVVFNPCYRFQWVRITCLTSVLQSTTTFVCDYFEEGNSGQWISCAVTLNYDSRWKWRFKYWVIVRDRYHITTYLYGNIYLDRSWKRQTHYHTQFQCKAKKNDFAYRRVNLSVFRELDTDV